MSILALDKWARLIRIISQHGGPFGALNKLWKMDTLKEGTYKGKDRNGNRYFQNKNYMIARSRWVEYNSKFGFDYDASQVSSEWYGWLHYKTDRLPSEDWAKYCLFCSESAQKWLLPATENMTGTDLAYYPYGTTRPHISVWDVAGSTADVIGMRDAYHKAKELPVSFHKDITIVICATSYSICNRRNLPGC